MQSQQTQVKVTKSTLRKKLSLCPAPSTNSNAVTFLRLVNKELEQLKIQTNKDSNISTQEAKALKQ